MLCVLSCPGHMAMEHSQCCAVLAALCIAVSPVALGAWCDVSLAGTYLLRRATAFTRRLLKVHHIFVSEKKFLSSEVTCRVSISKPVTYLGTLLSNCHNHLAIANLPVLPAACCVGHYVLVEFQHSWGWKHLSDPLKL